MVRFHYFSAIAFFSERPVGCIGHMETFGQHFIVLNTAQAARDLMDKRAYIYSNRPRMVMLDEL